MIIFNIYLIWIIKTKKIHTHKWITSPFEVCIIKIDKIRYGVDWIYS